MTEREIDEIASLAKYHFELTSLLDSMDAPDRGRTIMNIGDSNEPQMVFGVLKTDDCPVTSLTLPPELLFALANSSNFRLLVEDELLKCEEQGEKLGVTLLWTL